MLDEYTKVMAKILKGEWLAVATDQVVQSSNE